MSKTLDSVGRSETAGADESQPDITDAPSDIGDTTDLADPELLQEERARRLAGDQPDLPDRAFDRITPQV